MHWQEKQASDKKCKGGERVQEVEKDDRTGTGTPLEGSKGPRDADWGGEQEKGPSAGQRGRKGGKRAG